MEALEQLRWTKSLDQVTWAESRKHTEELNKRYSLGTAYTSPLVFDMNPYVDVAQNSSTTDPVRRVLTKWIPTYFATPIRDLEQHRHRLGQIAAEPDTVPSFKVTSLNFVDYAARFTVSFFGGSFLLAPIIAMSFAKMQNLRLVIASVFVLVFSALLGFLSSASNQEILAGSAGYAAVLVVFVGSALSTTPSNGTVSST